MGEPLVITVFLLTAVTMRFPFTCKQPLWAVQLGHHSAGFTLSTYAHTLPGQQEKAAEALATMLNDAKPGVVQIEAN